MELDASAPLDSSAPVEPAVASTDAPGFDLESYIARYSGYTKLARLQLVAKHCPRLEAQAYTLLAAELQLGVNTACYRAHSARLAPLFEPTWCDEVDAAARANVERLEGVIAGARSSMAKEQVRAAYEEMGDFLAQRGDLQGSLKHHLRSRDFCSSHAQMVSACLRVIGVATELNNLVQVNNHVSKAESAPSSSGSSSLAEGSPLAAQLSAASALAMLKNKQYKAAARKFASFSGDLGDAGAVGSGGVMAAEDVALYGTLCGLAEFDREEQKSVLLKGPFQNFLELVPSLSGLVHAVVGGNYGTAMAALDGMQGQLMLDLHLKDHATALVSAIQDRCVIQYFSPYLSVSMEAMATTFAMPLPRVEAICVRLVMDGHLAARVDSAAKTLHVRTAHRRSESLKAVSNLGEAYVGQMRNLLLRMSCLEHDLIVKPDANNNQSSSSGGRSMAGAFGAQGPEFRIGNQQDGSQMDDDGDDDL